MLWGYISVAECLRHFGATGDRALHLKAAEFGEKTQIWAISPFKVIQGHQFWYQSKLK